MPYPAASRASALHIQTPLHPATTPQGTPLPAPCDIQCPPPEFPLPAAPSPAAATAAIQDPPPAGPAAIPKHHAKRATPPAPPRLSSPPPRAHLPQAGLAAP